MKISGVGGVTPNSGITASRKSEVVLRMEAIRKGLRKHGAVIVKPDDPVDAKAIERLKKLHGSDNVNVERSNSAKLTIANFKRS